MPIKAIVRAFGHRSDILYKMSLLWLLLLGLATGASAADSYRVHCQYYYQDSAIMINTSTDFVKPLGYYAGYMPGTKVTFTCDPKAISTLMYSNGYYVAGWDFTEHRSDGVVPVLPGPWYSPTVYKHFGAVNPLTVTFTQDALDFSPKECVLTPQISMMRYTLAYDANGDDVIGETPAAANYHWSAEITAAGKIYTRTGYTLAEDWNTKADGTGVAIPRGSVFFGETIPVTNNGQRVTLYAQWIPRRYALSLEPGTGIAAIFCKTNAAAEWMSRSAKAEVPVTFGETWSCFATAKPGYTYKETSERNPKVGIMAVDGAYFNPIATANPYTVFYDGNGKTSGSMSDGRFTYDEPAKLSDNTYALICKVTYDTNGAGSVDPRSESAAAEFVGWNSAADGTGEYSYADHATVTNVCSSTGDAVTLYAQWKLTSVTLPNPVRTGARFLGWYTDKSFAFKAGDAGDVYTPTKDTTLYAKWQTDRGVLRFGFGPGIARIYYRLGDSESWVPAPAGDVTVDYGTKWSAYAVAASGYAYTATSRSRPASGTVTATPVVFEPSATPKTTSVTYNGNGSTSGQTTSSKFNRDEPGVLSDNGFACQYRVAFNVNYAGGSIDPVSLTAEAQFLNWNSLADGSGDSFADQSAVTNVCGLTEGSVILYAQWQLQGVALPEPVRNGYAFAGWYADKDCTFKVGDAGDDYVPTRNTTLYAKWNVRPYALSLRLGTGIATIRYRLGEDGEWTEIAKDAVVDMDFGTKWYAYALAKPGYDYTAYNENRPASGTMGEAGAQYAPSGTARSIDVAYVGNGSTGGSTSPSRFVYDTPGMLGDNGFVRSYHVTFNAIGGTVSPSSADGVYTFTGWNTSADGTGNAYSNQQTVVNLSTGSAVTLYAQWTNVSAAVELPLPVMTGVDFYGWYADRDYTVRIGGAGDFFTPASNTTLYAKWNVKTYSVTFRDGYAGPGSVTNAIIRIDAVPYGGSTTPPTPPVHAAYKFTGWSSSGYEDVKHDCTVYSCYSPIAYHVTYNSNYGNGLTEQSVLSAGCGPESSYDYLEVLGSESFKMRKTGYQFAGWSWMTNSLASDWKTGDLLAYNVIEGHLDAAEKANLYAVWEPAPYYLAFDANGGDGEMANQIVRYDRPTILDRNAFTREGWRFIGWEWQSGKRFFEDRAIISNLTDKAEEVIQLTAQWERACVNYVRFDPNGATNGTMSVQQFKGMESQHLSSNAYTKVGYTFAGWATNEYVWTTIDVTNIVGNVTNIEVRSVCATNISKVAYADRQSYAFPSEDRHGTTNTLFAVWEPIHYTIIFNTGADGVTGTLQPITNCAYDTEISIPLTGYENIMSPGAIKADVSQGFLGWALKDGSALIEDKAVNLATGDCDCVTLYAQWTGVDEMSVAIGLTNAVLTGEDWYVGKESGLTYVVTTDTNPGRHSLQTRVRGPGTLSFKYYWRTSIFEELVFSRFTVKIGDEDEEEIAYPAKKEWLEKSYTITSNGISVVYISSQIDGECDKIDLRLRDIVWEPDPSAKPEYELYQLNYANLEGAVVETELPRTYWVTNETFAIPTSPAPTKPGYRFAGWSPAKIEKGTTGDITVIAKWVPVVETHTVTFDLGKGSRKEGSAELVQQVDHGFDAVAPELTPPAGYAFVGWDRPFTNVTSDLTVTASYGYARYFIEYVGTKGVFNPNPQTFTSADAIGFEKLEDTAEWRFVGWSPKKINKGTAGDVSVEALWAPRSWKTVTYDLGEHLLRIGGGALIQTVEDVKAAVAPEVRADEGYAFYGWGAPVVDGSTVVIPPMVSRRSYSLTLDDRTVTYSYGDTVTARAPRSGCTGYIGTGNVPGSGNTNEVTFVVTGPGTLTWVYEADVKTVVQPKMLTLVRSSLRTASQTEVAQYELKESVADADPGETLYCVRVMAGEGGSVTVCDPAGGICVTNEFMSPTGVVLSASAKALPGWRFLGWGDDCGTDSKISFTVDGPVDLRALFTRLYEVKFNLGDHLVRLGGGELSQSVPAGGNAVAPEYVVDEGCFFEGWSGSFSNVTDDIVISARVRVGEYEVSVGGESAVLGYGELVTVTAPFDEVTEGLTNIVCCGYAGTGCAPASGLETQVTFAVTGPASVTWLYQTNYFVKAQVEGEGAVSLRDPAGGICDAVAFWAPCGYELTAVAQPVRHHPFREWKESGETDRTYVFAVTAPVTLTAVFDEPSLPMYDVSFALGDRLEWSDGGKTNRTIVVREGDAVTPPEVKVETGYSFGGWSADTSCVVSNMMVYGAATVNVHQVVFVLGEHLKRTGGGALEQVVRYGAAAIAPTVAADKGFKFTGWDCGFTKVLSNLTVNALVEVVPPTEVSVELVCDTTRGKVSGGKIYKVGKRISVRATPFKGHVFEGWYDADGQRVSTTATYTFVVPAADVKLEARFLTTAEDAATVNASVNGLDVIVDGTSVVPETNVWAGIYLEWPVAAAATSSVTVAVSGLPSGLKFTAKPITKKVTTGSGKTKVTTVITNMPPMTIYGTPTAGGKTSTVKITVTTAGKTKVVSTMKVSVTALPTALVGTYAGGSTNTPAGSATVTLAKTGKVSGKWISEGKTWTISATNLLAYDPETETFSALATIKNGKTVDALPLTFGIFANGKNEMGVVTSDLFSAVSVNWKVDPWKTTAALFKGMVFRHEEEGVTLSAKIGANGSVTVAGSFDVGMAKPYTASAKGVLMPEADGELVIFVYYPPKASKNFPGRGFVIPIISKFRTFE